jgi:hypothetical protein
MLDWFGWLAILFFGLGCVAVLLWMTWVVSSAPMMDCVCLKCGITDMDDDGRCERCGLPVELEERKE